MLPGWIETVAPDEAERASRKAIQQNATRWARLSLAKLAAGDDASAELDKAEDYFARAVALGCGGGKGAKVSGGMLGAAGRGLLECYRILAEPVVLFADELVVSVEVGGEVAAA